MKRIQFQGVFSWHQQCQKINRCVTWAHAGCCVSWSALLSVVLPCPLFKQLWVSKGVCVCVCVCCKLQQPGCAHVWLKPLSLVFFCLFFLHPFIIFFNFSFIFFYPFCHALIRWVLRLINCVVFCCAGLPAVCVLTPVSGTHGSRCTAHWSLDSQEHARTFIWFGRILSVTLEWRHQCCNKLL